MHGVDLYLARAKGMQPPRVLPDLLRLLRRPNLDSSRIARLISTDKVLTGNVLRLCNSARFGSATPIVDMNEAVTRVGFHEIYRTVAAACGARLLGSAQPAYGMEPGELWRHSFVAATAAQLAARQLRDDQNTVFTATLLHDIGKVILAPALEEVAAKFEKARSVPVSLVEAERKTLGVGHDETGGRLLEKWTFPPNLVSAVWFHHVPKGARSEKRLASYVALGNLVACLMGFTSGHLPLAVRGPREIFAILGLTPESVSRLIITTFEQLQTPDARASLAAAGSSTQVIGEQHTTEPPAPPPQTLEKTEG
jgi:putative nucleotidyltransferase with HDIG domain